MTRGVTLANYDFMSYFLAPTCARPGLAPGAAEANIHSPCPSRGHNLVAKVAYRSALTVQGSDTARRDARGCEACRGAPTRRWEARERQLLGGVTASKQKQSWDPGSPRSPCTRVPKRSLL